MSGSPWGQVQDSQKLAPGVRWVSTAGHGGFLLTRKAAAELLTQEGQRRGKEYGAAYLAYEEDCDWAILGYEHPELTAQVRPGGATPAGILAEQDAAYKSLSGWHADYLLERDITPSQPEYQNYKDRHESDQLRAAHSPDLIVCARGDWWTKIPGTVEVITADERRHFVTAASYDKRGPINRLSLCQAVEVTPEQIARMGYETAQVPA